MTVIIVITIVTQVSKNARTNFAVRVILMGTIPVAFPSGSIVKSFLYAYYITVFVRVLKIHNLYIPSPYFLHNRMLIYRYK